MHVEVTLALHAVYEVCNSVTPKKSVYLLKKHLTAKKTPSTEFSVSCDHSSQIITTNRITMKNLEILQDRPTCDRDMMGAKAVGKVAPRLARHRAATHLRVVKMQYLQSTIKWGSFACTYKEINNYCATLGYVQLGINTITVDPLKKCIISPPLCYAVTPIADTTERSECKCRCIYASVRICWPDHINTHTLASGHSVC